MQFINGGKSYVSYTFSIYQIYQKSTPAQLQFERLVLYNRVNFFHNNFRIFVVVQ